MSGDDIEKVCTREVHSANGIMEGKSHDTRRVKLQVCSEIFYRHLTSSMPTVLVCDSLSHLDIVVCWNQRQECDQFKREHT